MWWHLVGWGARLVQQKETALQTELQGLRLNALRKRAKAAGVDADDLEDTTESDDPKAAVIQLLLAHAASSQAAADDRPTARAGTATRKRHAHA